jgi:hypothetical protein
MSVNITRQGIINASGNIGANLLAGSYLTNKLETDGSKTVTYTCPDRSLLKAGTKVTVSVDIEVYNVASMRRIGVEPSFTSSGGTMYIGAWTTDKTNRRERIYSTTTLSYDAINLGQNGIYIQDITFNSGGYIILRNPKLEIGDHPTPWCPNINDDIYVGSKCGFSELDEKYISDFSIGLKNEYIVATEFIEI